MTFLLPLDVSLLTHHSDRLVGSLDLDGLDIADRHAVNHCSLRLFGLFAHHGHLFGADRLGGKMPSSARISKAFLDTLSLTHGLMSLHNVLSRELLRGFVGDPLQLLVLHLPRDSLPGVVGHGVILVLEQLLLNRLNRIINSVTDIIKSV